MNNEEQLRYPSGRFSSKESYTKEEIQQHVALIEGLPKELETLIKPFSTKELDTPYRDGGWTVRQVLHHISDSHMNAYIRFKWALTENTPVIKSYDEKAWAETVETKLDPSISLAVIFALHAKWAALLKQLDNAMLMRDFIHPDTKRHMRLDRMTAMYAWHGQHHLGHIRIVANKT